MLSTGRLWLLNAYLLLTSSSLPRLSTSEEPIDLFANLRVEFQCNAKLDLKFALTAHIFTRLCCGRYRGSVTKIL